MPRVFRWKSWEQVRDRLRELHRDGERMTTIALKARGHADLIAAAQSYATSWNKALAKAKVPITQVHQTWTAKLVLDGIRALHSEGVSLNANVVIDRGQRRLVKAATAYFGTWQGACRAAVPSYKPLVARWTIKRLVDAIRERHEKGLSVRSTIVQRQAPTLTSAAKRLGISWREACRRAKVPASAIAPIRQATRVRWNEQRIFAELDRAFHAGTPLLTRSFNGGFVGAVMRRFGSWVAAMDAAGFGRQYASDYQRARANRLGGAATRSR